MDFIAEIIADIVLALGVFLFQWAARHKEATYTIFAVILIVIDILVLIKITQQ